MYFDCTREIKNDIEHLSEILNSTKGKRLICMDSNSRSQLWFDDLTNARGIELDRFLSSQNLILLNEFSDIPTFQTTRAKSNIDLTVSSYAMIPHVSNWKVSDEVTASDHNYILFNISQTNHQSIDAKYSTFKYHMKNANWNTFAFNLSTNLSTVIANVSNTDLTLPLNLDTMLATRVTDCGDLNSIVTEFQNVLIETCSKSFPKYRSKKVIDKRAVPWWSNELTELRKEVNRLRRRYQRTYTNQLLREERKAEYFTRKKAYTDLLSKSKSESWKEFCNLTDKAQPWNFIYKSAANKLKSADIMSTLKKEDGSFTVGMEDTLEVMMDKFVVRDDIQDDDEIHKQKRLLTDVLLSTPNDLPFTTDEIIRVADEMNPKKSPGKDGLNCEVFRNVLQIFPTYGTALYNECLKRGVFPTCWKISQLIPIVKPGKESSRDVSKYRPISLLPVGGKILEKLLIQRVMHSVLSRDLISPNQYGFLPQRSTLDAIMAAKGFVSDSLKTKNDVLLISLDVQGAFDAAWWPAILNQMRDFRCPQNLYSLTKNYFSDRYGVLENNNLSIARKYTKGCPQGSCCGPGFWVLLYDSLLRLHIASNIKLIAFADDLLILISAKALLELEMIANSLLLEVQAWAYRNKMRFNPLKSKVLLISKKRVRHEISVFLNNQQLEQVPVLKYLGVLFDEMFTWNDHVEFVTSRCAQLVHRLARNAKVYWGVGCDALHTIYTGAILPLLLYAVPAWIDALKVDRNRRKLCSVQRLMVLRIIKGYRTISYDAACIIANVVPVCLKAKEQLALYEGRVSCFDLELSSEQEYDFEQPTPASEWIHPATLFCPDISSQDGGCYYSVFTDGSKMEDCVGSAFVVYGPDGAELYEGRFRLASCCSNNQAELLAILKALIWLEQSEGRSERRSAIIKSDSQVSLMSMENSRIKLPLLMEIRLTLKRLEKGKWRIRFMWVKAHCGTEGNERADHLAKEAALSTLPISYNKAPKSHLKAQCRSAMYLKWEAHWQTSLKGGATRAYFPHVFNRQQAEHLKLGCMLTQALSGHGKNRAYLHRFCILESALCPCEDGSDQTWDHIIFDCSRHERERSKLIRSALTGGRRWPLTKLQLLSTDFADQFIGFLNTIKVEE